MKITTDWKRFKEANVSDTIRRDIIKTLGWIERCNPFCFDEIGEELLAQSMINIYLIGQNEGLKMAREEMSKSFRKIGH